MKKKVNSITNYTAGDFLIKVKNAALVGKKEIEVVNTKITKGLASALKRLRYFDKVEETAGVLKIELAYRNKRPYLTNIKLVSKPGLRIYRKVEEIEKHKGPSVFLISTPKGILSSREVLKEAVGGEVIAEII
jgi:small subunit ribosomal protein S8